MQFVGPLVWGQLFAATVSVMPQISFYVMFGIDMMFLFLAFSCLRTYAGPSTDGNTRDKNIDEQPASDNDETPGALLKSPLLAPESSDMSEKGGGEGPRA